MEVNIREEVRDIMDIMETEGYLTYVVGGAIRNQLLKIPIKDWDLATNATPKEIIEIFNKQHIPIILTGLEHGTVTICYNGLNIEMTTFRKDGKYSDNRRPDNVDFNVTLEEDLARRDFTINALAYNKKEGVIDLFYGLKDLKTKTIRCVGNAQSRFSEDALRMLRAIRFANTLNFEIEENTLKSILILKQNILNVSKERIEQELTKIFTTGKKIKYFEYIYDLLPFLFKENAKEKIADCNILIEKISSQDVVINLTSLFLYDILNLDFLKDLRYSNKIKSEVESTISCYNTIKSFDHTFYEDDVDFNVKEKLLNEYSLLTISRALKIYKNQIGIKSEKIDNISLALVKSRSNQDPISISDLDINGYDLIENGIYGEEIGHWLKFLQKYVWKYPNRNKKIILLGLVKNNKKNKF